jgi:uncharacterized membrane protein (UPF0136 family)
MNAFKANILNSVILIIIGLWGYLEVSSPTALIPVGFGVILLFCSSGVKKQNKIIAHVAVLLTLLILVALVFMRLPKSIGALDLSLVRLLLMISSSIISMIFFIRSFIDAKKDRK